MWSPKTPSQTQGLKDLEVTKVAHVNTVTVNPGGQAGNLPLYTSDTAARISTPSELNINDSDRSCERTYCYSSNSSASNALVTLRIAILHFLGVKSLKIPALILTK